jgi:hypothetical protein
MEHQSRMIYKYNECNRNEFPNKEGFRSCLRRLWIRQSGEDEKLHLTYLRSRSGIYQNSRTNFNFKYMIPAGCTKDMEPIDQGLAARIHDRGKKVTSIKGLDKVVQETINKAWIKQVWAEVKRRATE